MKDLGPELIIIAMMVLLAFICTLGYLSENPTQGHQTQEENNMEYLYFVAIECSEGSVDTAVQAKPIETMQGYQDFREKLEHKLKEQHGIEEFAITSLTLLSQPGGAL